MNTKTLTKSAIMVALATVLSLITVYKSPNGGSITAASMVPIILVALTSGFGVSIMTALVYAIVQMVIGFYPPPVQNLMSFIAVIMLDYIVAFGVLGFAGLIAKQFKNGMVGAITATIGVVAIRFICHFLSGILIWTAYAPEGIPLWQFSAVYQATYLVPETIISVVVVALLYKKFIAKPVKNKV